MTKFNLFGYHYLDELQWQAKSVEEIQNYRNSNWNLFIPCANPILLSYRRHRYSTRHLQQYSMKRNTFIICLLGMILLFACNNSGEGHKEIVNSVGMKMILIPAGEFEMGANDVAVFSDGHDPTTVKPMGFHGKTKGPYDLELFPTLGLDKDELPRRKVTITKAFYIGKYEVTQKQWKVVMGGNPSFFKDDNRPVENVSFNDVQKFIRKLNSMESSQSYRLPTEAQWEYAARGGSTGIYIHGNSIKGFKKYAWYFSNSKGKTRPVGRLEPNGFGLFDVIGNVWEWCSDWYDPEYYSDSADIDPVGPSQGIFKVFRGSSWFYYSECCRVADRENTSPTYKNFYLGFRLVKTID